MSGPSTLTLFLGPADGTRKRTEWGVRLIGQDVTVAARTDRESAHQSAAYHSTRLGVVAEAVSRRVIDVTTVDGWTWHGEGPWLSDEQRKEGV